ncbi:MAG: helix-turn-helix domain-containing protein [Planctomycetota bacterium]|jgi:excisionase family DNA binding protein
MLTVPEAARRLRVNPETIRRWIRAGRLRAKKVGTQHLIEETDLENLRPQDLLPLPRGWKRTATAEPVPDVLGALRRSRARH